MVAVSKQPPEEPVMSIAPETLDRLTAGLAELVRTGRHLSSRVAAHQGDLPSFGWALLVPLERDGDQRCSALAARAGVDVSVASRQLGCLERQGYVERRPDPQDGRAALFRLTPAGVAALAAARSARSVWATGALADWDEDDARLLADLVDRLVSDLGRAARTLPASPAPDASPARRAVG
jgi:DNA-binding MarR family transcriptional regulator